MRFKIPGPGPPVKCVWVHLDVLWRRPGPGERRMVVDGLDATGRVPGMLLRWLRTSDGLWLGEVHVEVGHIDGRRDREVWSKQLVPASRYIGWEDALRHSTGTSYLRPDRSARITNRVSSYGSPAWLILV
jgi:hypothetical protein